MTIRGLNHPDCPARVQDEHAPAHVNTPVDASSLGVAIRRRDSHAGPMTDAYAVGSVSGAGSGTTMLSAAQRANASSRDVAPSLRYVALRCDFTVL